MSLVTLLQTRTAYPAVTPIDPDECLILDQQTDQPEGEQSTVATLSELIATGGRTVTTAIAYETLYADSVVNVSASSITITVGAMRNGSRLLIRRTAAYDGNPVTISPPSGATFEGLASLKLYGQYSFVELERISSTVFAIKDLNDSFTYTPVLSFGGASEGIVYTQQIGKCIRRKGASRCVIQITTTNKGTSTGNNGISTPTEISGSAVGCINSGGITYSGMLSAFGGGSFVRVYQNTESGTRAAITETGFANGISLTIDLDYIEA